ncbi:universal stress protein [Microlunatus sp. Gsoil 973]|uniref:universal stress protein n=1 Tax=Microlunatus sp. Gsoil 973 TaxID=2672569 RepID=UPI0012B4D4F7|nr:hypothetical protein GJV80_15195 [Microlunatus sp. Gsoil 973]
MMANQRFGYSPDSVQVNDLRRSAHHSVGGVPRVRSILVGVDGSDDNRAAVHWAVERAMAAHRPLCLVAMLDRHSPDGTDGDPSPQDPDRCWRTASDLRDRLRAEFPDLMVGVEVRIKHPVAGLVDLGADEAMIVVGHRAPGAPGCEWPGSTSHAVAGRSTVPTIVVPPDWNEAAHQGGPVCGRSAPGNLDNGGGGVRFCRGAMARSKPHHQRAPGLRRLRGGWRRTTLCLQAALKWE